MNQGGAGARSLNIELQAALNPAGDRKVERFGWTFAPGDKVMQIENDYDKEVYKESAGGPHRAVLYGRARILSSLFGSIASSSFAGDFEIGFSDDGEKFVYI
jgi:hypothetical protein